MKFLDPFTKSGEFLREITTRLTKGLEQEIPNLEARVSHILTRQVYGIAITHLTGLLTRRSVYCSKHATGEHSITKASTEMMGIFGLSGLSILGAIPNAYFVERRVHSSTGMWS